MLRAVTLAAVLVAALPAAARAALPTDTVIVKFRDGTSATQRSDALDDAHADATVGSVPGVGARVVESEGTARATAAALDRDPRVDYAEVNRRMRGAAIPNDPLYSQQWGLNAIRAPMAWDARALAGFPAGGGPLVGLVDSGVRLTHQDLAGAVTACMSASTTDAGSQVTDGSCPDENGHGTHVTGTVVARAGNGVGGAGVAFNSSVAMCKALNAQNVGLMSDISACITALRDRGARIIGLSLVGPPSETLQRAVEYAWAGGSGALVVAAAGNDGTSNTNYPAGYPEVVSVAATDSADGHPAFSTSNDDVELSAPGVGIVGPYNSSDTAYALYTGTSMAVPFVTGVAALVATVDRTASAARLRAVLDGAVDDLGAPGRDPLFGFGRINAARALAAVGAGVEDEPVQEEPAPPPEQPPAPAEPQPATADQEPAPAEPQPATADQEPAPAEPQPAP